MTVNKNESTLTAKNIKSAKWLLYICVASTIISDIIVVVSLCIGGYDSKYVVYPIILLALNLVFSVVMVFTNYRFKYSIVQFVFYFAAMLVFSILTVYGCANTENGKAITKTASILSIGFHVVICVVVLLAGLFAAKSEKIFRVANAVALIVLLAVSVGVYGGFIIRRGAFGQDTSYRTLTYTYDDASGSYKVSGVLNGRGDSIRIPESFDGKSISSVDCGVFVAEGIERAVFSGGQKIAFENVSALRDVAEDFDILADKKLVDEYKKDLYGIFGRTKYNSVLSLANNIRPQSVDADEIYVTFAVDTNFYDIIDGKVLPTWFGKKGDILQKSYFDAENYPYLANSDITDVKDLDWCYEELGGNILTSLTDEDGTHLFGNTISKSINGGSLNFEKIVKVIIADDNDEMYETPSSFKNTVVGSTAKNGRYVMESTVDELFEAFPKREGFDLDWQYSLSDGQKKDIISSAEIMSQKSVTIYPVWSLKMPSVTISCDDNNGSVVYGASSVTLNTQIAEAPVDLKYTYSWSKDSEEIGKDSSLVLHMPIPLQSGNYSLTVTAYSTTLTSLQAQANQEFPVTIAKKEINVLWREPTDFTYDGTEKSVTAYTDDAVGDDVITFTQNIESVMNVGSYHLTAQLDDDFVAKYEIVLGRTYSVDITQRSLTINWTGLDEYTYNGLVQGVDVVGVINDIEKDNIMSSILCIDNLKKDVGRYTAKAICSDDNYVLSNPTCNFAVLPRDIRITWGVNSFVYDSINHLPSASAKGVGGDGSVSLSVTGAGTIVGEYTATASTSNGNYTLENPVYPFSIIPATVRITWGNSSFIFDGNNHIPTASAVGVGSDGNIALTVTGGEINAGKYTATAGTSNRNYTLENPTEEFHITPASIRITWGNSLLIYNGSSQVPLASVAGVGGDGSVSLSVTGAGTIVGEYTATASTSNGNYTLENPVYPFSIIPATVRITWGNSSFIFDGNNHIPTASAVGVGSDGNIALTVTGGEINAGKYTATAGTSNRNYTLENPTESFSITPKTVTLSWESDESLKASCSEQSVSVLYEYFDEDGTSLGSVKPTADGIYVVKCYISERNYEATAIEKNFEILNEENGDDLHE